MSLRDSHSVSMAVAGWDWPLWAQAHHSGGQVAHGGPAPKAACPTLRPYVGRDFQPEFGCFADVVERIFARVALRITTRQSGDAR